MALLSGIGTSAAWWFEFRAPNNQPISDFQEYLQANGVPVTLTRLYEVGTGQEGSLSRLTDSQSEALRLAFDNGYFNEPRENSLETLAEEVGITRQAFAGRLRRGLHTLLAEEFTDGTA
jgi:predicted DNA binding protein